MCHGFIDAATPFGYSYQSGALH
jgi:Zn-dependent metalloprotease